MPRQSLMERLRVIADRHGARLSDVLQIAVEEYAEAMKRKQSLLHVRHARSVPPPTLGGGPKQRVFSRVRKNEREKTSDERQDCVWWHNFSEHVFEREMQRPWKRY